MQSKEVLTSLQTETATLQTEVNQAQQILTLLILTVTDPQHNQSVQTLSSLINSNIIKIRANVCTCILAIVLHYNLSIYRKNQSITTKRLCQRGVFVKALDQALSSFSVGHQAYHGGSFIGNHIHKALKVNSYFLSFLLFSYSLRISRLCTSLVTTAATMSNALKMKASEISEKFIDAFILFS